MTIATSGVTTREITRYAQLKDAKRVLESQIDKIKDELNMLEPRLLDHFAEQGINSMKLDAGWTVYLRGQWWARPKDGDYERACEALRKAGLEGMVHETVNVQTLSAWVREQKKEDPAAELPWSFQDAIVATQQFNVLVRKS